MKLIKKQPTKPGFYWARVISCKDTIVEVFFSSTFDRLMVWILGNDAEKELDYFELWSEKPIRKRVEK
jgi:hypothetical protein